VQAKVKVATKVITEAGQFSLRTPFDIWGKTMDGGEEGSKINLEIL